MTRQLELWRGERSLPTIGASPAGGVPARCSLPHTASLASRIQNRQGCIKVFRRLVYVRRLLPPKAAADHPSFQPSERERSVQYGRRVSRRWLTADATVRLCTLVFTSRPKML